MAKTTKNNKEKSPRQEGHIPPQGHPSTYPLSSASTGTTKKQQEVLSLISKGLNPTQISRKLNLDRSSIRDRLKGLIKKGLVKHKDYSYIITKSGNLALGGGPGASIISTEKGQHSNDFTLKIDSLPREWQKGNCFIQSLTAKEAFHSQSTKTWYLYFEDCKIRIAYNAKKITFWLQGAYAKTFDALQARVWDRFVFYYKLMTHYGFRLDHRIRSSDPHLTNPDGLFARMASATAIDSFRIDTDAGSFWVDRSPGYEEEEYNQKEIAERMQKLGESAMLSSSDFTDIDKLKEISGNLVKLRILEINKRLQQARDLEGPLGPIDYVR